MKTASELISFLVKDKHLKEKCREKDRKTGDRL